MTLFKSNIMNNFFRAIIAGYGAKKLGGGCFGTIIVFILIWVALGQCSFSSRKVPPPQSYPADKRVEIKVESESTLARRHVVHVTPQMIAGRDRYQSKAQSTTGRMSFEGTTLMLEEAPLSL